MTTYTETKAPGTDQYTVGILPAAEQAYLTPDIGYYPGQQVAGFNPIQQQAWQSGLGAFDTGMGAADYMRGNAARAGQMFVNHMNADPGNISAGFTAGNIGAGDIGSEFLNMMTPEEINAIQGNFEISPYVNDQVNAYQDAFTRGFQRSLPQYDVDAMLAGQMGSSRHGISEGLARSDFQRQLGEGTAGLLNTAYQQAARNALNSRGQTLTALGQDRSRGTQAAIQQAGNRANLEGINTRLQNEIAMSNARNQLGAYNARMGALSSMPSMLRAMGEATMLPYQVQQQRANYMSNIGNQHQALAQQQIAAEMARWEDQRNQPWNQLNKYANIVSGLMGGGYGTDQKVVNEPSVLGQILEAGGRIGAAMV